MTPPRTYKTQAVVLRSRPLGEADRVVTLFTLESGKLDAVAKGVRRARSHLGGRLQFGNECRLEMHRGRSLDVIVAADVMQAHWEALVEPARFAIASLLIELVASCCEPDLALPEVYALLVNALAALARSQRPPEVVPRFGLRLLDALGVAPPLGRCVQCDLALADRAYLDARAGGLLDEGCREPWRDLPELDADDLANLRALAVPRGGAAALLHARPRVAHAVDELLAHHLGRRPKSAAQVAGLGSL